MESAISVDKDFIKMAAIIVLLVTIASNTQDRIVSNVLQIRSVYATLDIMVTTSMEDHAMSVPLPLAVHARA
jgi:hypothetical protein